MKTLEDQLRLKQELLIKKRNMINIQIEKIGNQRLILDIKKLIKCKQ